MTGFHTVPLRFGEAAVIANVPSDCRTSTPPTSAEATCLLSVSLSSMVTVTMVLATPEFWNSSGQNVNVNGPAVSASGS